MRMFADTFLIIIHLYCMIACSGISESDSSFCGTPVSTPGKVMFLGTVFVHQALLDTVICFHGS